MFSFADFRFPSFARPLDALRRLILQEPVSFHDSAISSKPFPTCRRLPVAFDGARCSKSSTFQCFNLSTFQPFFKNSTSFCVARPRWLMAFFSLADISAKLTPRPSGSNTGS